MKILHTSDLHLGKNLSEESFYEDQKYILEEIIKIVIEQNVKVVIIPGDIYDKSIPSSEASMLFDSFLTRLSKIGVKTLITSGNHDSNERLAFGSKIFDEFNIHIVTKYNGEIDKIYVDDVCFYMLPFLKPFHLKHLVTEKEYDGLPVTDVDVILYNKEHAWIHPYSGKYRNYGEIKAMIERTDFSSNVKKLSRRIFDIKAQAESEAHGVLVDEVQFHEVGAVDSIVDVVGTAICLDYVGAESVISTHVPTGFGTIECACGTLPVPAPATTAILKDTRLPHYRSDV